MAKVLVQESSGSREFDLVDLEVSIGRELDNTLRLPDPSISRHHATIKQTNGGHEIQDLGSSNGVLINGTRVETALLQDGDRITLGQLQLTYMSPKATTENPIGTVRMTLEDMAKLQAVTTAEIPAVPRPAPPVAPQAPAPPPRRAPAPKPVAYAALPEPPESGLGSLFRWIGSKFRRS